LRACNDEKANEMGIVEIPVVRVGEKSLRRIPAHTYVTIRANATGTHTGINAAIVLALQVAPAVDVVQALAAIAVGERITAESGRAGAHRTSTGGLLAHGIHAARIPAASATVGLGCLGREGSTQVVVR